MSLWGLDPGWSISGFWGVGSAQDEICEQGDARVLIQMDDADGNRDFRELVCVFLQGLGHYVDVAQDVSAGFDVDTAIGQQLDFIGSVVGLPRQGFSDTRYRVFLNIQIDLLLSAVRDEANWTGTNNNILKIVRTFIGATPGQDVVLTNLPPYSFELTIPGITLSEMSILVNFLCVALYAGVLGQVVFILGADSLWDSDSVGPIVNGGIWCSASVAVVPCATWGLTVTIGTQPCE